MLANDDNNRFANESMMTVYLLAVFAIRITVNRICEKSHEMSGNFVDCIANESMLTASADEPLASRITATNPS